MSPTKPVKVHDLWLQPGDGTPALALQARVSSINKLSFPKWEVIKWSIPARAEFPADAGLSDYPHYDAYRVTAPSADAWAKYDRWGGQTIRWGAPLETIGDRARSLRELNRPRPIAYWSQEPITTGTITGGVSARHQPPMSCVPRPITPSAPASPRSTGST